MTLGSVTDLTVKLLTEHHLESLSLKGGCTGSSESTLVKMPHCWKSHVTAHMVLKFKRLTLGLVYNTDLKSSLTSDSLKMCLLTNSEDPDELGSTLFAKPKMILQLLFGNNIL